MEEESRTIRVTVDGRPVADLVPGDYAISVLSVAELHEGAIRAKSVRERAARIARLALIE